MSAFLQQIFELITTNPATWPTTWSWLFQLPVRSRLLSSQLHSGMAAHRRLVAGLSLLLVLRLVLFFTAALSWQGVLFCSLSSAAHRPPNKLPQPGCDHLAVGFPQALPLFRCRGWSNGLACPDFIRDRHGLVEPVRSSFRVQRYLVRHLRGGICRPAAPPWDHCPGHGPASRVGSGSGHVGAALRRAFISPAVPTASGDFAGAVRLTQMAAFALLFTLPQRFTLLESASRQPGSPVSATTRSNQIGLPDCLSFLTLASHPDESSTLPEITRLMAVVMDARVCFLAALSDQPNLLNIKAGYLLPAREKIGEAALSGPLVEAVTGPVHEAALCVFRASTVRSNSAGFEVVLPRSEIGALLASPFRWEINSSPHALVPPHAFVP
jgi:hypothetical protein